MLLKIGYFLRNTSTRVKELISATIIVFADNTNYTADSDLIKSDNNSIII
jgi:hypothetical protein